ncbi:hypothetical protein [Hyphomicrobium sp.]|jgi:hypothetical protein|uniref:hypothetical protein n=1 Tax=Hyphomicrobium sp. TaxID=82 RepID=UPI002FE1B66C
MDDTASVQIRVSHPADRLRAVALLVLAVSLFALLDTTAKYLITRKDLSVLQVVWARYVF